MAVRKIRLHFRKANKISGTNSLHHRYHFRRADHCGLDFLSQNIYLVLRNLTGQIIDISLWWLRNKLRKVWDWKKRNVYWFIYLVFKITFRHMPPLKLHRKNICKSIRTFTSKFMLWGFFLYLQRENYLLPLYLGSIFFLFSFLTFLLSGIRPWIEIIWNAASRAYLTHLWDLTLRVQNQIIYRYSVFPFSLFHCIYWGGIKSFLSKL